MTKSELIDRLTNDIKRNAYTAKICEELKDLGFDSSMMEYHCTTERGKAFEAMEILGLISETIDRDEIFESSEAEALNDIREAEYDTVTLLNLAGFDGPAYYAVQMKYNF